MRKLRGGERESERKDAGGLRKTGKAGFRLQIMDFCDHKLAGVNRVKGC